MKRLAAYSRGFLGNRRLRDLLGIAGYEIVPPWTKDVDGVAVWGARPVAVRGHRAAARRGVPVVHVEDAFLRSVGAGWRELPLGLTVDEAGFFADASRPSDLENILNSGAELREGQQARIRNAIDTIRQEGLSKYNAQRRGAATMPTPGFVLVADQVPGDASIGLGGANAETFNAMLTAAITENPGRQVMVRRHPEGNTGHFDALPTGAQFLDPALHPMDALDAAARVYCVTSQLGFDAILRGHRPVVFGQPFYAGWGLTEDRQPIARRVITHSVESLAHWVLIDYCTWIDPIRRDVTDLETALETLIARKNATDATCGSVTAIGMRLWKRRHMRAFFPEARFNDVPQPGRRGLVWASADTPDLRAAAADIGVDLHRVEDGFLRSSGLGAALVPPMSLAIDDLGIYYDPTRDSRLERLIGESTALSSQKLARAARLRDAITTSGTSKYNLSGAAPNVPGDRPVVLVLGQVEDDASIRLGATDIKTNLGLLRAAREQMPDDFIAYKPHPDVESGLRVGAISEGSGADAVWVQTDINAAITAADVIVTMTSLAGFEALIRGKKVICYGMPFYAGWGLTTDHLKAPRRRAARPSLDGLVHAALIDYPIYRDPVTGQFVRPEDIIWRLASGTLGTSHRPAPVLSKLQGAFAGFADYWR